jgi:hypothetical protein
MKTLTLLGPLSAHTVIVVSTVTSWIFLLCIIPTVWPLRHRFTDPRRTHPKPGMWGTWFIVGSMATIGQAFGGAAPESWIAKAALSTGPLIIAVWALIRHEPLIIEPIDRWSLILCGIGIVIYVPLFFGWIGPAEPEAAGLVVVIAAILVDTIASVPFILQALRRHAPIGEVVTFAIAFAAVLTVLAILPVPWTWLNNLLLCFLACQQIVIIWALLAGRARNPRPARPVGGLAAAPPG